MNNIKSFLICLCLTSLLFTGCSNSSLQDAANRYFVDAANGSDNNNGKRATPLASIQEAMSRVQNSGGEVIVAGGDYTGTVTIYSDVMLRGGFDPAEWIQDTQVFPTKLSSDETGITGNGVLDSLIEGLVIDVTNTAKQNSDNLNTIGVSLHSSDNVIIMSNIIKAGKALPGPEFIGRASNGENGDHGESGKNAEYCSENAGRITGGGGGQPALNSNAWTGGSGGEGGSVNSSAQGFMPGIDSPGAEGTDGRGGANAGSNGTNGLNGDNGVSGIAADELGSFSNGAYLPTIGTIGGRGEGGSGGGGGAGANEVSTVTDMICGASGGGGGAGAGGGYGGNGGKSGGASIGVLLTNSTNIAIDNNIITTIGGGNGGGGQFGGFAGTPGDGGNAGQGTDSSDDAGFGGNGGNGGNGGTGGGGAGGPSFGIAKDLNSLISVAANTISVGPAGTGTTRIPRGKDGLAAEMYKPE